MQAVSKLYARRLRGDIGPLQTDPATRLPGRILGPAVSLTGYYQDYEEATTIQHFELGSRMQLIRNRVFYYARVAQNPDWQVNVGQTPMQCQYGVKNSIFQAVVGTPGAGAIVTAIGAPGATQVVVTIANTDGLPWHDAAGNGTIGLNALVGGHIAIFPTGGGAGGIPRGINREIIANTAVSVATTLAMTVTLDRPLPVALQANSRAACMASEYAAVQSSDEQIPVVGVSMLAATALQYIWLQTWGPSWMAGSLDIGNMAVLSNNYQVVFQHNGALGLHGHTGAGGVVDPNTVYAQHAGYIMTLVHPGSVRGAPFVFLQITP